MKKWKKAVVLTMRADQIYACIGTAASSICRLGDFR